MEEWQKDLLKEKSFFEVWLRASRFRGTRTNNALRAFIILTLTAICLLNELYFGRSLFSYHYMTDAIRSWATSGIGFASQVLGFLVAGFTISATLTKPTLFILLAQARQEENNISHLKFIFFNFMYVFGHYIGFLSFCIIISMFGGPSGAVARGFRHFDSSAEHVKVAFVYVIFVILGYWFLNLLILLKSFVWNVYQSVVISIAFEGDAQGIGSEPIDK